ncbi:MAG: HtaA domain-containing protein [Nocardioides sp.]|uniref:HtaA domain-containing protein n=1 Tax=Nocardioides sp. TaxID=35761 RepID=UPI0039E4ECD1
MSTTTMRRRVAALAAGSLGAGALAFVAATPAAHAAEATPVSNAALTWTFAPQAASWGITTTGNVAATNPTTATPSYATGDSFTKAEGFSLSSGSGSFDSSTSTGEIDFTGSVTYSPFANYGSLVADKSTVTFTDFELDITSATRGALTAQVSYHKPSGDLAATEATVANFDITSLTVDDNGNLALQTAAPDWTDVTKDTGGNPGATSYYDSWPINLVTTLRTNVESSSDISVYFYRTGNTSGNTAKIPAAFSATGSLRTVTPSVSYGDGSGTVSVSGTYFSPTDGSSSANNGIYVGVAPSGGLPDVSSQAAMANFAGANWVSNSGIVDGAFSTSFAIDRTKLDPTKSYSVYTWRAHSHSETTQDSETPLAIDFDKLKSTIAPAVSGTTSLTYGQSSVLSITAPAAGTVTISGLGATTTVAVADGKASFTIPATLAGGSYTGTVAYTPAEDETWYNATSTTVAVTVAKLAAAVAPTVPKKASSKKALAVTYSLGTAATGKLTVTFKKGKKKVVKTVTLSGGKATVKLTKKQVKKLGKGTWKITTSYAGNAAVKASSSTTSLKVK